MAVAERLRSWADIVRPLEVRPAAAVVFLYHTVEESPSPWTAGHRYVTPRPAFEAQLRLIRERFTVLPTRELLARLSAGPLERSMAAIHFDDGFRSYGDVALPILRRLGLPSALFPVVDALHGKVPLRNKLAFALNKGRRAALAKLAPEHFSTAQALARLKGLPDAELAGPVDEAFAEAGGPAERSPFHTAAELSALARDPLVELGSHTLTHAMLSTLDEPGQRREIHEGHERLSALAGRPLPLFAYPFGGRGHFDAVSRRLAAELPGVTAFSTYGGVNRALDRADVRRVTLTDHSPLALKRSVLAAARAA